MSFKIQITILLLVSFVNLVNLSKITASFKSDKTLFNVVALDDQETFYIAATNRIYKLSQNLNLENNVTTGPKLDNPDCPPTPYNELGPRDGVQCNRTNHDNINRILTLDKQNNILLSCSPLFWGFCEKFNMNDLTQAGVYYNVSVVGQDPESDVAYTIGPGSTAEDVFYVGASGSLEPSRYYPPAISTRRLSNMQTIVYGVGKRSEMNLRADYQKAFVISYKHSFVYNGFTYFLTVQKPSLQSTTYDTRISRVCNKDPKYYSYVEVPLSCVGSKTKYNVLISAAHLIKPGKILADLLGIYSPESKLAGDVLFTVFAKSAPNSQEPTANSGICAYNMKSVEANFDTSVRQCFKGTGKTGPAHFTMPQACQNLGSSVGNSYCGEYEYNYPMEQSSPIFPTMVLPLENTMVTSISLTTMDIPSSEHTVAFLGTNNGHIMKMLISSITTGTIYEEMTLHDQSRVHREMFINDDKGMLYAMTKQRMYQIQISNCSRHQTCDECKKAEDPFCGWCTLENKCTEAKHCKAATKSGRWLQFDRGECPVLTRVEPPIAAYSTAEDTEFKIHLSLIPDVLPRPKCILRFGSTEIINEGNLDEDTSTCMCPPFKGFPDLSDDEKYFTATLSINYYEKDWLQGNVTFYACEAMDSCTDCAQGQYACVWCIYSHQCVYQESVKDKCQEDDTIHPATPTPQNDPNVEGKKLYGNEECPRIESTKTEYLIPAGTSQNISLTGVKLQTYQSSLTCRFGTLGQLSAIQGPPSERREIVCPASQLQYDQNLPFKVLPLDIAWDKNSKVLDNPQSLTVKLYKCSEMAANCGECLTLEPQYQCGWCGSRCSLEQECPSGDWLNSTAVCPKPRIDKVMPNSGPLDGGTIITITGINLGKQVDDILDGVFIAGIPCTVIPELYVPTTSIFCKTGGVRTALSSVVKVTISKTFEARSTQKYRYVNPLLNDFHPTRGPRSGGTSVSIMGRNLDAGNNVTIKLGGLPCQVLRRNASVIEFLTARQERLLRAAINVSFDGATVNPSLEIKFDYQEDPTITGCAPKSALYKGGNLLTVTGTNLNVVKKPQMFVEYGGKKAQSICEEWSMTAMRCPAPNIDALGIRGNPMKSINFAFIMDGVDELKNLTDFPKYQPLQYYSTPTVYDFEEPNRLRKVDLSTQKLLEIKGENLNVFAMLKRDSVDVNILVGGSVCVTKEIHENTMTCFLPSDPETRDKDGKALVEVKLGNFIATPGWMNYRKAGLPLPLIIGIALGLVVILILVIVIIVICLRRKRKSKKDEANESVDGMRAYRQERGHTDGTLPEEIPLNEQNNIEDIYNEPDTEEKTEEDEATYVTKLLERIDEDDLKQEISEVLISRKRLELGSVLGKGHFGRVYAAKLLDEETLEFIKDVAVKTLQGNQLEDEAIKAFLKEGVLMKKFKHQHVLELKGVSINKRDFPMVVLPFMANGDLRSFVKNKKRNFTARQLLFLAQQVAEGMSYLASLNFVHRDLAARNCMIDEDNIVKVADFGLSKDLYDKNYYTSHEQKKKMPIKWMALESLENYVFSTKSDIWSFGVLMWELMTRGVTPYPDVDVFDIRTYLSEGRRLTQPKYCPDPAYKMMISCWNSIPKRRPTFPDLVNSLELLINPSKALQDDEEEPLYMNIASIEAKEYVEAVDDGEDDEEEEEEEEEGKDIERKPAPTIKPKRYVRPPSSQNSQSETNEDQHNESQDDQSVPEIKPGSSTADQEEDIVNC